MREQLGILTQPPRANRFTKNSRLLKRAEFKVLLDGGTKVVDRCLVLVGGRSQSDQPRIGLIVSKKVGNAVVRNHVKRRLREHFRTLIQELPPVDLVVIARHRAAEASFEELTSSFDHLLEKLLRKLKANSLD